MSTSNLPLSPAASSPREHALATADLRDDLARRSARGGALTLASQGARFALQLGSTMILARLLAPAEFGLVAMVTVVTGFVSVFRDAGLSTATVQREALDHRQVSALFWINSALGVVLAAAMLGLAPLIAWFYGNPTVAPLAIALGAAFIPGGLSVQHHALLRRRMRFGAVAAIDFGAFAAGAVCGVSLAVAGAGPWALVGMTLTTAITNCIAAWIACPWRPGRPRRAADLGGLLSFGGDVTGAAVLTYIVRRADDLMIGWCWGPALLGLYTKAYALLMLPLGQFGNPIGAVAVPALSRLQAEPARHRAAFLRLLRMLSWAMLPPAALLTVFAADIVDLVLGAQWTAAKPIFVALALSAFVQPLATATGWLQVSIDQTRRMLVWSVIAGTVRIVAFAIALPWGPLGVAVAFTVTTFLLRPPHLLHAMRPAGIRIADALVAFGAAFLTCAGAALAMAVIRHVGPEARGPAVLASLAGGAASLALTALICSRVRRDLADVLGLARGLATRPGSPT